MKVTITGDYIVNRKIEKCGLIYGFHHYKLYEQYFSGKITVKILTEEMYLNLPQKKAERVKERFNQSIK